MGLFDTFKKNHPDNVASVNGNGQLPEIPKDLFIEENKSSVITPSSRNVLKDIHDVYEFLSKDYDEKGYRDSLVNSESSSMNENIELIKFDLFLLIEQVITNYEDRNRELDTHIESRSRAGLIDLVEELKSIKQTIQSHLNKISTIKKEAETDTGSFYKLKLSYQKGFKRGFVALSHYRFFNNGKTTIE